MDSQAEFRKHLYALILAGGGGTRLWPRSRNDSPKQFLPLFGGQTLTQITTNRFSKILPWEKIFVVTVSEAYKKEIEREVPKIPKDNIIVEPDRRETAPAHGLGALFIHNLDPDAVIMTEAADRLVKPVGRYLKTLLAAAETAFNERVLLAVGVEPRYPHSGLGHIKKGHHIKTAHSVKFYKLDSFVEKPPIELAKKYTESGDYFWNAGQFVWRADSLLDSLAKNSKEVYKHLNNIRDSIGTSEERQALAKEYKAMPKIAIDYAVAEKDKNFYVVEGDFHWTDIGDWKEVWENLPQDESGNVVICSDDEGCGEVINIDTSDALIHSNGRLIAVVDVDNIVIVDTKDALLVCSKSRAQSVKKVVERLKEEKKDSLL